MQATTGEKWFYALNAAFLSLFGLLCLLPLLNIAAMSLSDSTAVLSGHVSIFPIGFTFQSYQSLFEGSAIGQAFVNSVVMTVVGVVLCLAFTIAAAYPLSKREFYARKALTLAVVFTMLFTGGLIPSYLVVRSLGLVDTYGALWLPGLISVYNMLIMKTYFENLPEELEEAARIDGAGELTFIGRIALPLSAPMLATIALFYGVGFWNSFMNVLIYINDPAKYNLMVLVQNMIRSQSMLENLNNLQPEDLLSITPEGVKSAGVIVLIVPLLAVYPFLQKYFVKGAMIGAIKG